MHTPHSIQTMMPMASPMKPTKAGSNTVCADSMCGAHGEVNADMAA